MKQRRQRSKYLWLNVLIGWPCLNSFEWSKFITSSSNSKVQYNHLVKHPRKALLSIFHLNASAALKLRFLPQTQKLKRSCAGIINSTTGKFCSVAFIWMVTCTWHGFWITISAPDAKVKTILYRYNKQHHREVLFSSFHLNGHMTRLSN